MRSSCFATHYPRSSASQNCSIAFVFPGSAKPELRVYPVPKEDLGNEEVGTWRVPFPRLYEVVEWGRPRSTRGEKFFSAAGLILSRLSDSAKLKTNACGKTPAPTLVENQALLRSSRFATPYREAPLLSARRKRDHWNRVRRSRSFALSRSQGGPWLRGEFSKL